MGGAQQTVMGSLALEWSRQLERLRIGPAIGARANPNLYDASIGLGVLARVFLLRDVFHTEITRDQQLGGKPAPKRDAWLLNIERPLHAEVLFKAAALAPDASAWEDEARHARALLNDATWRQSLCDGFVSADHTVRGLNSWFMEHYEVRLPGARMTSELLFGTRFFGSTAIDNFIAFVRTGVHRPGVNRTLLDRQFQPGGRLADESRYQHEDLDPDDAIQMREIVQRLSGPRNSSRPIVAMTCVGAPRHLTLLADHILQLLGRAHQNVCYVPVHRQLDDLGVEAGGFDSIVDVLHKFAQGFFDIETGDPQRVTSAVAATRSHSLRLVPMPSDDELTRKLDDIRAFCARTPTVFVFDGYRHSQGPYSAIADFVSDEPITRLLRYLVHPDAGDYPLQSVRSFAATHFLLVGDDVPQWARKHLLARYEFRFEGKLKQQFCLRTVQRSQRLAPAYTVTHAARAGADTTADEAAQLSARRYWLLERIAKEARFTFAENYFEAVAYMVLHVPDEAIGALESYVPLSDFHERLFDAYWDGFGVKPWARIFLSALAVSHTGLREGSAGQLLDTCVKHFCNRGAFPESFRSVSVETFREFIHAASATGAGIVNRFPRGADDRLSDQTAHAAQTFSAWTDAHLWAAAERPVSFVLRSRRFRLQVLRRQSRPVTVAVSRMLAEICLQSHRMLCVELPPAARRQRRARRWLTEVLCYGMNSLELDRRGTGKNEHEHEHEHDIGEVGVGVGRKTRTLPEYTLGEIPAHPIAAYGFLYFTIFKELLCGGNIASIGRESGDGELELELLRFCGNPSVGAGQRDGLPSGASAQRWTSQVVRRLLQDADGANTNAVAASARRVASGRRAQDAVVQHLLEYCRAARRASRPKLLYEALRAISDNFAPERLSLSHQLAVLKFDIDLRALDSEGTFAAPLERLMVRQVPRAIAASHGGDIRQSASRLRRAVLALWREAADCMEGIVYGDARFNVDELDGIVERAFAEIDAAIQVEALLPDAIALLARAAIAQQARAVRAIEAGQLPLATRHSGSALCAFWLLKIVGARRQMRNPTAAPARVGWQVAESYLSLVAEVKLMLRRLRSFTPGATKTEWLERRLHRTARSTLDTFLREQGGDHADHIVALILESKFVRHFGARAATLMRHPDRGAPTKDMRLAPLLSAYKWLRQAEREVLDFTARPSLRVMLCEERVYLATEILDRAALATPREGPDIAVRPLPPSASRRLYPFLDLIEHDLRQLRAYCDFIDERDDASPALGEAWHRTHERCRLKVSEALDRWFDINAISSYDAQWNEAVRDARVTSSTAHKAIA